MHVSQAGHVSARGCMYQELSVYWGTSVSPHSMVYVETWIVIVWVDSLSESSNRIITKQGRSSQVHTDSKARQVRHLFVWCAAGLCVKMARSQYRVQVGVQNHAREKLTGLTILRALMKQCHQPRSRRHLLRFWLILSRCSCSQGGSTITPTRAVTVAMHQADLVCQQHSA